MRQSIERIVSAAFRAAAVLFYLGTIVMGGGMIFALSTASVQLFIGYEGIDAVTTLLVIIAWPSLILIVGFAFDRLSRLAKQA